MSGKGTQGKYPQDLVAIFHASFHPTQGNVIDWSLKASDGLSLDNIEFSALPSGLHLVEQDVVYFTREGQHGVCVFRRRKTTEQGHRGFRLTSFGILLAKSRRPRPWQHIRALKDMVSTIYSRLEMTGDLQPSDDDWEPARVFFEERKVYRADLGGAGDWTGWSNELDGANRDPLDVNPTLHLPHLLRILGPSSLTLYKHVLGRRRILIYTLPPVEAACILCQVAADMCYENQVDADPIEGTSPAISRLKGKSKDPISVLGMVTLMDLDRMRAEGQTGRGWIACTTDAIFLEKPQHYDLLIDLTTSTPSKATRPTLYSSKALPVQPGTRGPTHRLSAIRFSWSDVKLWNELERILQLDSDQASHHACCGPSIAPDTPTKAKFINTWTDAWRVYEDVCIICAGLWMGSWRGNSTASYSTAGGAENWGAVRLEGDDDLTLQGSYVRNVGMGIEGVPVPAASSSAAGLGIGNPSTIAPASGTPTSKSFRRASAMSWSSGRATVVGAGSSNGKVRQPSSTLSVPGNEEQYADEELELEGEGRADAQLRTTLAILQTFHAHTSFQLSVLESFLPRGVSSESEPTIYLSPRDILAFELGPLSGFDAKYLEWLALEYGGGFKVIIKRGWRDLLGVIFGYG
ncbi:hypothetical protein BDQ12DRAFT_631091 [Crucibulum laeve]|uniref:Protein LCHN n=1 Tax=Crucibulum laeve TaxID=68775 RepID=A0A5C3M2X7_9AGAR|nr:hypothetical protein BDQ12DRAFT_631091 [Crucibulum laeve]